MNSKQINDWMLARLTEPSTWRGMAAVIGAVGLQVSPDSLIGLLVIFWYITGLVNIIRKES